VTHRASAHQFINPDDMMAPSGFSHAVVATPGRLVFVAGQTAHQADGTVKGSTLPEQFAAALANVAHALEAAGSAPADLVQLHIFTTDVEGYRTHSKEIGAAYREICGPHYPPMALFGVTRLYDTASLIELVATAVIPDP
jgi:enamine deaminase RidA (YjgF/YER057c/UK114 family)